MIIRRAEKGTLQQRYEVHRGTWRQSTLLRFNVMMCSIHESEGSETGTKHHSDQPPLDDFPYLSSAFLVMVAAN